MKRKNKSKKKSKKRNPSDIVIPSWAKELKPAWVTILNPKDQTPKNYQPAIIKEINKETKKAIMTYVDGASGPQEVYCDELLERSETPQILDDLVDISPLNDAELLRCLQLRYENDDISCFCGPTLIATNPYKRIKKAVLSEDKQKFREYALGEGNQLTKPHIWNIAARTFRQIFENETKQAICISGESGAGKTFLTEMVMAFLTSIFEGSDSDNQEQYEVPIEQKILGCNPIMENFGNAKTVKNDNSSRFGKYFVMFVDRKDKHIYGAEIKNYLLEKSRIITQAETERNYHVFYGILEYMEADKLKKYGFCNNRDKVDINEFEYLKHSKCFKLPKKEGKQDEDKEFYDETCKSLKNLGFSEEESDAIFKILACVLNFGNIPIDESTYEEGSEPCKLTKNGYMARNLRNLKVDFEDLSKACCTKIRNLPGGVKSESPLTPTQSEAIKDALAKDLYNNCFNWIVKKLNLTLLPDNPQMYTSIGLLDIFGFEDFEVNSLEQFCINYTNEKLQNLYIDYVFKAEKKIFKEEGLEQFLSLIKYTDNQPVIDLMGSDRNPVGIFSFVDSVSLQATNERNDYDKKLVDDIVKAHKDHECFFINRLKPRLFGVSHTAKDVFYTIDNFVEKNKDELPPNLLEVLDKGDEEISKIFNLKLNSSDVVQTKKKNQKEKFLGYKFKREMQSLMDELLACECNFVRAIKPNEQKTPDLWVPELALCQIKYLGILDSIKVRRDSLPIRKKFKKFYEKFQDLDSKSPERFTSFVQLEQKDPDWKQLCLNVIESLEEKREEEMISGKTRIFMSVRFYNNILEILEEKQRIKKEALIKIISSFKAFDFAENWNIMRKRNIKMKKLSKNLMESWNCKLSYAKFRKTLEIIEKMQENFRVVKRKEKFRRELFAARRIAKSHKLYKERTKLKKMYESMKILRKISRKMNFKAFIARIRICKRETEALFEDSWKEICRREKDKAIKAVQRIWKGYKARLQNRKKIEQLELFR